MRCNVIINTSTFTVRITIDHVLDQTLGQLTESLALGATVMSRIGSHISAVENDFVFRFSSKTLASRKKVTDPIFLCVSLVVSFETFLLLSFASFGGLMLKVERIFGARSLKIKLPCRFSDLYVPLNPVYV